MVDEIKIDKELLIEKIRDAKKISRKRKFEQSMELIITIKDLDLKKPENRMLLTFKLPRSLRKKRKICVFSEGPFAEEARKLGADKVITKAMIEELAGKKREIKKIAEKYDFFLAQPQLMGLIGKYFGFALGPRGKMPSIVSDISQLKERIDTLRNSVRIHLRKNPEACCIIGTEKMDNESLAVNAMAVISGVYNKIREKAKIGKIYVKTTMGKPVRVF